MKRNKIFGNKTGAEKTISIYWFAILIIVAGAMIYMVSLVYGEPYDVRQAEAEILSSKIANCLSEGGYLKEGILIPDIQDKFAEVCSLNLEANDFPEGEGEYYVEVVFSDFDTNDRLNFDVSIGNAAFKQYCGLKGKNLPACSQQRFYVIDNQQKKYVVDIIAIVNKIEKNT